MKGRKEGETVDCLIEDSRLYVRATTRVQVEYICLYMLTDIQIVPKIFVDFVVNLFVSALGPRGVLDIWISLVEFYFRCSAMNRPVSSRIFYSHRGLCSFQVWDCVLRLEELRLKT